MFQRTILSALAVAAGVAAGLALRVLTDKKYEEENEPEEDDEIRFLRITDDEDDDLEGKSDEVKEICAVYPYLKPGFVEKTLAANAELNEKYPEDTLLKIDHRSQFSDPDAIVAYDEIMKEGGYETTCEGSIVTASKKFFTENGAVISDVLNVANQTGALKGTYIGYDLNKA